MDIEYQTYGWVFGARGRKDYEEQFHWRHPSESLCITVSYDKESKRFLGINTFGIRMRHELFDRWLTEERTVEQVMEQLADANFDPEFYRHYEKDILDAFNRQCGTQLRPQKKSLKRIFQSL